ncbi:MAG: disulfide bond formation protein B, partial [Gammaproteobacteria bacterium]|nr:disulfide bond formation protein B [Gammaproteobacteria bacterium]
PACGPSLEYLIDVLPFTDVLAIVLNGDGSCAEVAWSLLGLSIPAWVVVACIPLILASLWLYRAPRTPAS